MQDLINFLQNHLALALAAIALLLILSVLEFMRLKQKAAELTPAEVTRLINRQNAVVVDVRASEAYETGHIVDAVSIPLTDLKDKSTKLDKMRDRPIILVCNTGLEAARTAVSLKEKGYNVHVLGGGIQAWRRADLPLVKG